MDIASLLNQAGGVGAIADRLGVDQATVERGAGALLPHVANGVEQQGLPGGADAQAAAVDQTPPQAAMAAPGGAPGGLGGMLGGLLGGAGAGGVLGNLVGGGVGDQILGHIFGSKDTSRTVAAEASQQSGVDTSILKKLLPIVAGAVAMHYAGNSGQGAASAGGGGILGSVLGGLGNR